MPSLTKTIMTGDCDLSRWLRDGDRILLGQGSGEPASLTSRVIGASHEVANLTLCIGLTLGEMPDGGESLSFESYGALGTAARLPQDRLTVLPLHYSHYVAQIVDGRLPCDVVMVQLSPPDTQGRLHLGMGDLHLIDAARRARVVIAEINPATPRTCGSEWPSDLNINLAVEADTPPPSPSTDEPSAIEQAVAANVADLVPDRAVLQFGIGRLPDAIAQALCSHRDLGIHSGVISDGALVLDRAGALTNAAKEIDAGFSVGGVVVGKAALFSHIDDNAQFRICPTTHTHSAAAITKLSRFCAINSAVEIDLLGQVNAETAAGRRVGGTGGQVDFTRAARLSPGGRAIVAVPSTARGGKSSRIVPRVETVTLACADADTIVTEWGVAELHGVPAERRAERIIAIADPAFREELARQWHDYGRHAHV